MYILPIYLHLTLTAPIYRHVPLSTFQLIVSIDTIMWLKVSFVWPQVAQVVVTVGLVFYA